MIHSGRKEGLKEEARLHYVVVMFKDYSFKVTTFFGVHRTLLVPLSTFWFTHILHGENKNDWHILKDNLN